MPNLTSPALLSNDDLVAYGSVLEELRVELEHRANLTREGADVPSVGISFGKHVGDGTGIAAQRFEDVTIHGQVLQQLAAVDQALGHMAGGTYGICLVCNHQIAIDRLDVIPWAATCVACA